MIFFLLLTAISVYSLVCLIQYIEKCLNTIFACIALSTKEKTIALNVYMSLTFEGKRWIEWFDCREYGSSEIEWCVCVQFLAYPSSVVIGTLFCILDAPTKMWMSNAEQRWLYIDRNCEWMPRWSVFIHSAHCFMSFVWVMRL